MSGRMISAKTDLVFKALFQRNRKLLDDFIPSVTNIPRDSIKSIEFYSSEIAPESIEQKFSRLDLSLRVNDEPVNIEVQVINHKFFRERLLYYWARMYEAELPRGEDYSLLKRTILVAIVDFEMFPYDGFFNEVGAVIKGTDDIFSDKFSVKIYELPKVTSKIDTSDRTVLWLNLIKADSEEAYEMINKANDPVMNDAITTIKELTADEQFMAMMWARDKASSDEKTLLREAREEGIEEGFKQASAQIKASLKEYGMSEADIKKITDHILSGGKEVEA